MIPDSVRKDPLFVLTLSNNRTFDIAVIERGSSHTDRCLQESRLIEATDGYFLSGERIDRGMRFFVETYPPESSLFKYLRYILVLGGEHAKAVARVVRQVSRAYVMRNQYEVSTIDEQNAWGYILGASTGNGDDLVVLFEPNPVYLFRIRDGATRTLSRGTPLDKKEVTTVASFSNLNRRFLGLLDHDTSRWLDHIRTLHPEFSSPILETLRRLIDAINLAHIAREKAQST